jgi:hypothetical protein
VIDKEWLESEIGKLEQDLTAALARLAGATYSLGRARTEYKAAKEAVETVKGVIRGLQDELDFTNAGNSNDAQG